MKLGSLTKKLAFLLVGLLIIIVGCAQGKKNHKPVITKLTAKPAQVVKGKTSELTVEAKDEDDDTLEYRWSAADGSLSSNMGTSVTWIAPSRPGFYSIQVTVKDDLSKVRNEVTVEVTE